MSPPNNSFKPNLLRYSKSVAQKACHAFASTTQVGLIQALGAMSRRRAICALCGVTLANLLLVAFGSLLGVYGDGSLGAAPLVFCIGAVWVLGFAGRGASLIREGQHEAAVEIAVRALPYAFVAFVLGGSLFAFAAITFGWQ